MVVNEVAVEEMRKGGGVGRDDEMEWGKPRGVERCSSKGYIKQLKLGSSRMK